jgi:glycerophosphoryl diester phosphodiesterase
LQQHKKISIQGHRGARGLFPENTLSSFIAALKFGVDILEMDVVISKDGKVVVSHEPWMNEDICTRPDGSRIEKGTGQSHNLFKMPYTEIKKYDCGKLGHPEFPSQKAGPAYKPLLSEVIREVEAYIKTNALSPVIFNIEIKSEPQGDELFHPAPGDFARMVYEEVKQFDLIERCILQSFDIRILQELHHMDPNLKIGLLIENDPNIRTDLDTLGFIPFTYNPDLNLVNEDLVKEIHKHNMQIAVWTVNETEDMKRLIRMGVDSIITDHPDRAFELIK